MTGAEQVTGEGKDFYFHDHGPFTIRVYADKEDVEALALAYLGRNSFFGFNIDPVLEIHHTYQPILLDVNGDWQYHYSEEMKLTLSKEPALISIDTGPQHHTDERRERSKTLGPIGPLFIESRNLANSKHNFIYEPNPAHIPEAPYL